MSTMFYCQNYIDVDVQSIKKVSKKYQNEANLLMTPKTCERDAKKSDTFRYKVELFTKQPVDEQKRDATCL